MSSYLDNKDPIPGTMLNGGSAFANEGYGLNKMCYTFNGEEGRQAFLADEDAYCDKFGLTADQKQAVKDRNVLRLLQLGGNIYFLAKLAGIFNLNMQDIGAQQTGMSVDEFKAMLVKAGE